MFYDIDFDFGEQKLEFEMCTINFYPFSFNAGWWKFLDVKIDSFIIAPVFVCDSYYIIINLCLSFTVFFSLYCLTTFNKYYQ